VLAALLSTTLSATIGTIALCQSGIASWADAREVWQVWWIGDAMGILLVAPVLLCLPVWLTRTWSSALIVEALVLYLMVFLVSYGVFSGRLSAASAFSFPYLIFPFIVWAEMRFGEMGTGMVSLVTSSVAVWGTKNGLGPFVGTALGDDLVSLQLFMGMLAMTGLLLGAAIQERDEARGDAP